MTQIAFYGVERPTSPNGHAFYGANTRYGFGPFGYGQPLGWKIDGGFAPDWKALGKPYEDESLTRLTVTHGYTILSMWDRTADTRHASNANFVAEGVHTEAEMWAMAKEAFPTICARLKATPMEMPA